MSVINFLVYRLLLPVIALVLIIMWMTGGLGTIKETAKDVLVPKVSFGTPELESGEILFPGDQESEFNSLRAALEELMRNTQAKDCFATFGGFSVLGEEDDRTSTLSIQSNSEGANIIVKNLLGQSPSRGIYSIKGMKPCVVAGTEEVTQNFHAKFVQGKEISSPFFRYADSIEIRYSDGGWMGDSGNILRVQGSGFTAGKNPVNNQNNNFENGGLLFKGSGGQICFFPTNYAVDADEDGIANEWFELSSTTGLPLIMGNYGKWCKDAVQQVESIREPVRITFEEGEYIFTFDQGKNKWSYQAPGSTSWKLVDEPLETVPGGFPKYREVIEGLRNMDYEKGYDYLQGIIAEQERSSGTGGDQ